MKRKKSQVLYNFLPGKTFDHADNGIIGKITGVSNDTDVNIEELPKHYILGRIRPRTDEWARAPRFQSSDVRFVAPDDPVFEIFPRNFECSWCRCITHIDRDDLQDDAFTPTCENCDKWFSDTEQLQLVAICNCGELDSLQVPNHCSDKGVKLIRKGSSLADAQWMCECGVMLDSPYKTQGQCRACGTLEITVHSASKTFYPHRAEFVNARSDRIDNIRSSQHFRLDIVADHLAETVTDSAGHPTEFDDLTAAALDSLDPEVRQQIEDARQETVGSDQERLTTKRDWLEENFEEDSLRGIAEEIFEYESILEDEVYSDTLDDLACEARSRGDLDAPTIERYTERASDLNFASVRLVENFPITTAVYGYTRVTPEPEDNVRLRPLRSDGRDRSLDEVYVQTSDTEAIVITLEPEAIVEWLDLNIDSFEPPTQDVRDWLLQTLTEDGEVSVYPYHDEMDRPDVARYPLVLLHTLSHLFINTVDALSGYEADSLVEYTLPRALTFVVYKRSNTDFSLGSMFTMVENRFDQICDYLEDDARACLYDPLCENEENSACEGCIYVSSRTCKHGNRNLARSTVYGGDFDDGTIDVGFFDV